jgi:hypothetical protein
MGPESAPVSKVVHDALGFARWSGSGIQEAPLQADYGALVLAPQQSIVRHQYGQEMPEGVRVKYGLDEHWGSLLRTLKGHTDHVTGVAFSTAGDRLASGLVGLDGAGVGCEDWTVAAHRRACTLSQQRSLLEGRARLRD